LGGGIVLVVLGCLFLLGQIVGGQFWSAAWPLIIVGVGLIFFVGMATGGKAAGGLAIPGTIVTTVGLILLYQNTFNHYESWSYLWALIPLAVGLGLMINGYWSGQPAEIAKGRRVAGIGALLFIIGFVFFEFVIGLGRFGPQLFGGVVGPLFLVIVGVYLVLRNWVRTPTPPMTKSPESPPVRPAPEDQLWTEVSTLPSTATYPPPATPSPVDNKKESAIAEKV
jgi:hypothetical protein